MRAVVLEKVGSFAIRNIDVPHPKADEILVHVSVIGLCRTDLKLIRAGHRDMDLPRVPGHEVVGTIYELGYDVKGFSIGDRVYLYPGTSCGMCKECKSGAENLCREMKIMGFHRDGGFAEYVSVPVEALIPIPDSLSDEEAVFTEPLSCCFNAIERAGMRKGETIGIWGAGPIGFLLNRTVFAMDGIPSVMEPDHCRRTLIEGFRSPPQNGFDVCIIAVNSSDAYYQALSHLNTRGRLVVFSGLSPDRSDLKVDFNRVHYNEQGLVGAYGCTYEQGKKALEYLRNGKIRVMDLISNRLSLDDLGEALTMMEQQRGLKILIYP